MKTSLVLAQACADIYVNADAPAWGQSWSREGVVVSLRHGDDFDIVCFRGSVEPQDWVDDFKGWPTLHPVLGYCHNGFLQGMETVYEELAVAIVASGRPYCVTGHSLGAARALIFAAMMTAATGEAGAPRCVAVETFGTPRPGFARLSGILNSGGYGIRCWKNGHDPKLHAGGVLDHDPVTDVPALVCPDGDGYQHPVTQTLNIVTPDPNDHSVFAYHHMPLYLDGIKNSALL